jgi:hypothetical protein
MSREHTEREREENLIRFSYRIMLFTIAVKVCQLIEGTQLTACNVFPCKSTSQQVLQRNFTVFSSWVLLVKCKDVLVTDRGGPLDCETLRLPHFLDNRLTDDGEVVSLTRRPSFTPGKIPGTHFC